MNMRGSLRLSITIVVLLVVVEMGSAAREVAVLEGPGAEQWQQALATRAECTVVSDLSQIPAEATVVLPDRTLSDEEMTALAELQQTSRILALGKSVFTDGGPTASASLHVGKNYYYVPLLYPYGVDWQADRYEATAQWCAENGAHGIGVFCYVFTVPDAHRRATAEQRLAMTETIIKCFHSFEGWMNAPQTPRPPLAGMPQVPKLMFMHINDVKRVSPEGAAEWAEHLGCNVICLAVDRFRTHRIYASRFLVEKVEREGKEVEVANSPDYLPRLIEACKQRHIAFWANICEDGPEAPTDNQKQVKDDGTLYGRACPLSGAAHFDTIAQIIEEVLAKFPYISCITLDEPWMHCSGWKSWGCFCEKCKVAFHNEYGYELAPERVIVDHGPDQRQSLTEDFYRFRVRLMNEYVFEKYRRAINRARPGTPLLAWEPKNYDVSGIEPQSAVLYGLNAYGPEYGHGPGNSWYLNHPETFRPRQEHIIRITQAAGQPRPLYADITRVDCFAEAEVKALGQARDASWWPVLVSAREDAVRYCAFDPLQEKGGDAEIAAGLVQWLTQ